MMEGIIADELIKAERADFDCELFGMPVGRLELDDSSAQRLLQKGNGQLLESARSASREGFKLLYLTTPNYNPQNQTLLLELESTMLGNNVDMKVTYRAPLQFFSKHRLRSQSESTDNAKTSSAGSSSSGSSTTSSSTTSSTSCSSSSSSSSSSSLGTSDTGENRGRTVRIVPHPFDPALQQQPLSPELRALSLASGEYSRFKVDPRVSQHVFESLYEAWIQNSINRTLAEETFIAVDTDTSKCVGMITLKRKGNSLVDVGLLAVAATHRRRGVASRLLSKATLWAIEKVGHLTDSNPTLQVVTQGANKAACKTYERYGFTASSIQVVNHVWLPDHVENVRVPVRDRAPIPYCKQYLTGRERDYIGEILDSQLLDSSSRFTTLCSKKLKLLLNGGGRAVGRVYEGEPISPQACPGSQHVLVTNSGTAALEMAAILCNIQAGDEVLMPSYTFSSTANAFVLRGAVPVFIDIREDTLNINEKLLESAITPRTKAICCVHYAGIPCEMDAIMDIAARHRLLVIEDAAQGFLATYKGRQLGSIGHFGCLSFHYTKNVICGEGGALSVNTSEADVRRAHILWEKGTNRCDFMTGKIDKYEWIDVGSSHVPSEISCAILYAQLEECESITNKRLQNFAYYRDALAGSPAPSAEKGDAGLLGCGEQDKKYRIPMVPSDCQNNAHIFFLILPSLEARKAFETKMKIKGIAVFSHYVPLHSAPAGRAFGRVGVGSEDMAVTTAVFAGLLRLPVWVGLTETDLRSVAQAVREACGDT